jgi:hypothetical protein
MSAAPAVVPSVPVDRAPLLSVLGATGMGAGLLFAAATGWQQVTGLKNSGDGVATAVGHGLFGLAIAGYVALAVGLHLARPGGAGRGARVFPALLAAAWTALLAGEVLEAVAGLDPDSDVLLPVGGLLQAVALIGLGITTAGTGRWTGWRRWAPLALAVIWVGGLLVPAFLGTDPSAVAEVVWALGYAGLGAALVVEARRVPA